MVLLDDISTDVVLRRGGMGAGMLIFRAIAPSLPPVPPSADVDEGETWGIMAAAAGGGSDPTEGDAEADRTCPIDTASQATDDASQHPALSPHKVRAFFYFYV